MKGTMVWFILFMFEPDTPDQPKDPGEGSEDSYGKRKPEGNNSTKRIKYKRKISKLPVGVNSQN